jgi:hypothetical protein
MANLNLNTFPYYDDFNPAKGFHRVLFKPGYAVQARELTQIQTILQEQIKRFGNHIFKDGSVVFGCAESVNFNVPFIKILDVSVNGTQISNDTLSSFEGMTITGAFNDIRAIVKKAEGGSESESPNLKTLYIQYSSTGIDNTTVTFSPGETLTVEETGDTFIVAGVEFNPIGEGTLFSVGDGIVYANGNFIQHNTQTIIVGKYTSTPIAKVGFTIVESFVNSTTDETLLDPAQGSYNYTAPGADRYKLSTELVATTLETIPDGFYILFDLSDGKIKRKYNITQYAELSKTLARRTFDESGDYAVRAFPINIREHLLQNKNSGRYTEAEGGDSTKLVVGIEAGKAYVKGYEYELFSTEYIDIDKAIDTQTRNNEPITTGYGSYVLVDDVIGVFPINTGDRVSLQNAVSNATLPPGGTEIGTARVRAIEYVAPSQYRLYLFDIQMSSSSFENVRSVYYNGSVPAVADIILNSGVAVLYDSSFSSTIFESPYKNLSSVSSDGYVYRKVISSGINNANATATLTLPTGESWASTVFNTSNIANEIIVVVETQFTLDSVLRTQGQILTPTSVTYNSSSSLTIDLGGVASGTGAITVFVNVRKTSAIHNNKVLKQTQYVKFDTNDVAYTTKFNLGVHDVIKIDNIWIADYTEAYPDESVPSSFANWTDVTQKFALDNGQRDGVYEHASISLTDELFNLVDKRLVVRFSFFNHGTTAGYYTINSYTANSGFDIVDIAVYESSTGKSFNLRDCIDFRPSVTNTATESQTIAGATQNPTTSSTFVSGFTHPSPTKEFIADLSFYVPRIDRVIVDTEGVFSVIRGIPSLNPNRPAQPNNAMTLGFVNVAPFPSLSPIVARKLQKPEYASRAILVDNRRFTMRDIGEIKRKIDALEYSTALTLSEQAATNLIITNSLGENRYKNGILVDSFVGHNVGNVFDPRYNCAISNGQLRPAFEIENVDFDISSESSNIVRNASDAIIVVRQDLSAGQFVPGVTISSTTASGKIVHAVPLFSNNAFKWVRIYVENVLGAFVAESSVNSFGTVTGTITYTGTNIPIEELSNYPVLVKTPSAGSLATLAYTHKLYAQNPYASKTRNVSSRILFTHVGEMQLNPPCDTWVDTSTPAAIQLNAGGVNDNWEVLENPWNSNWNIWESVWQGTEQTNKNTSQSSPITNVAQTSQQRYEIDGCGINATGETTSVEIGNRNFCRSILPFMRERIISFTVTGLKANTNVYAFFDNINVSEHCRLENGSFGEQLVVDVNGELAGEFKVPPQTFSIGTKTFTICDNSIDPTSTTIKTVAISRFTSSGVSNTEENNIISTQTPQITFAQQLETRELVSARLISRTRNDDTTPFSSVEADPLAQTFFVNESPGGAMMTKLDVYFKSKSNTSPITLQLREVINGFPSETIVPYSSVTLYPRDVNVSDNATSATEFKFASPVYLKNDTEYCFVLLPAGNDQAYEVWVGEMGENEIGTTQRIDKQPFSGMLFISSNNRNWTPLQNEDLKFTLYQANFTPGSAGSIVMKNTSVDYLTFSDITEEIGVGDIVIFTDGVTTDGSGVVKYYNENTDVATVQLLTGFPTQNEFAVSKSTALNTPVSSTTSSPVLTGNVSFENVVTGDILLTNAGVVIGTVSSVSSNEITLTANSNVSLTAENVFNTKKATINIIGNKNVNVISPTLGYLDFNNTTTIWSYKLHNVSGVDPVSYSDLDIGTTELVEEAAVFSSSNITETFKIRGILTTSVQNVSPVVDLNKISCIIVSNSVNALSEIFDEDTNDGTADSRYITRKVVLDDGQESDDLRVYLNAAIPGPATIQVYGKLLNDTDQTAFDSRPWVLMTQNSPVSPTGFKEYFYTLPDGNTATLSGGIDGVDGVYKYTTNSVQYVGFKTFAVKIVFASERTSAVPIIRDLRVIALQA